MKIFIDSANPKEVLEAYESGLVDGVTTNPSLAAKAGVEYIDAVNQILKVVKGPVSLEVLSSVSNDMIEEGKLLARLGKQVVVKIPCTMEGLKATQVLKKLGIPVNMTLVFSANQALLAAKAGAEYVSPFVGRLDDIGADGNVLIQEIIDIFANYEFKTQILYASVRHPLHVKQAAMLGVHVATIPYNVFQLLVKHPLTDIGIERFNKDFADAGVEPLVKIE